MLWYVRRSAVPVLWIGLAAALVAGQGEVDADVGSAGAVWDGLRSPVAGIIAALLIRLGTSLAGVAMAYPLVLRRERALPPRTYRGAAIGIWFDRWRVATAFRTLRWTHEVRQTALGRLGRSGRRLGLLDPSIDVANVALPVLIVVVVATTG